MARAVAELPRTAMHWPESRDQDERGVTDIMEAKWQDLVVHERREWVSNILPPHIILIHSDMP
jgi:hypothetical protein